MSESGELLVDRPSGGVLRLRLNRPDRLNAIDGRRDRAVRGGPGNDVCRIDRADVSSARGCET